MQRSAGILIVYRNKVLLAHSTKSSWWKSYMPPKGGVEEGETPQESASREVFEEVGILIDPKVLNESVEVEYCTSSGKIYKVVHLFIHRIGDLTEIGLTDEHVPFSMLQHEEVDEAKFMDIDEVQKKILPRFLTKITTIINGN